MKSKDSGSYNGANRPVCFRNEETDTTVECGYDSQGRRYFKKVTVAGTTTLHHRYIYRGYLQIAALDLTRSAHPALWLVTWDPSQSTATRPLAIQKDRTWFTYGYDTTKSICEVFGPANPPKNQKTFDKLPLFDKNVLKLYPKADAENPYLTALKDKKQHNLAALISNFPENPRLMALTTYNSILASPFCCLIVVGIAIPFAVAGVRTNPMVGVSKSIGLFAAYFLLTNIFNALGAKQWLPPVVAAWAPNLILFFYAVWLCRKVN